MPRRRAALLLLALGLASRAWAFSPAIQAVLATRTAPIFPTVGVTATFTGTNGTTPPQTGWSNLVNTLVVAATNVCGGGTAAAWNLGGPADTSGSGNEHETYYTLVTKPADGEELTLSLGEPVNLNGYMLRLMPASGTDTIEVWTMVTGWAGARVGSALSQEMAAGDKLGWSILGSTIRVYRCPSGGAWGQLGADFSDATYTGLVGAALWTNGTTAKIDDWGFGIHVP